MCFALLLVTTVCASAQGQVYVTHVTPENVDKAPFRISVSERPGPWGPDDPPYTVRLTLRQDIEALPRYRSMELWVSEVVDNPDFSVAQQGVKVPCFSFELPEHVAYTQVSYTFEIHRKSWLVETLLRYTALDKSSRPQKVWEVSPIDFLE